MDAREREDYLREYSILKSQGKPFFPYAVAKDGAMALITLCVIILMAVLFGAELGPKADPTTTTYTPRPEWYFFFLFELLRVVKPPELTFMATIGIPTIALMLLLLLPFYDRSPERHPLKRPIAMIGAVATVAAMAYLSMLGALAGPPSEIEVEVASKYENGKQVVALLGLPRLPQDRREREYARAQPHRDRRSPGPRRDRAHPREPHLPDALLPEPARGASPSSSSRWCSSWHPSRRRCPRRTPARSPPSRRSRRDRPPRPRSSGSAVTAGSGSGTLPESQVRSMFDRIAGVYDRMNSVMTAGMHHRWRERAADLARLAPGDRALDVATGTGDLAIELARRVGADGEVVGMDFSEAMLEVARRKAPRLRFEAGNALALGYEDDEFAACTVGFGARNFDDLAKGLAEMTRVVRAGGRVVVLEITTPQRAPTSWFFRLWFDHLVPGLGRLAGDPDAYSYLPSSVRRFPGPEELAAQLARAGLTDVGWLLTGGGIIAIHSGTVPPPA